MSEETYAYKERYPSDMPLPKRSWGQRLSAAIIILVILAAGAGVSRFLLKTRPKAQRKPPAKMQILVETKTVGPTNTRVTVQAYGRVVPARRIDVQARVAGTVQFLHPDFVPGGILRSGEVLARLDDTDYRLDLIRKQNFLSQAEADLRLEEGNQAVARQEWELINRKSGGIDASSIDLALRKPQLEKVRAAVDSARTDVERVKVDLERTVIKVPFNAIVQQKDLDIGSQVTTQSTIATLAGTDAFWVEVSVPVDSLAWLKLPGKDRRGSAVRVVAEQQAAYEGRIVKLLPAVDENGLMARLLIEVDDPMGLQSGARPLLLGSFVRAEISGKQLADVYQLPRAALKDGDKVYTVNADTTLHIQPVQVLYKNNDSVFVADGLASGDRIIVTNVAAAMEGMPLLLNDTEQPAGKGDEYARGQDHGEPRS